MENEQEDNVTHDTDSSASRKKYPIRDLRYMVDFVGKIYTELGPSQHHSREDIAKLHNLEVTSIKQTMSTAVQYGLLELKHGTGYKVTPLFVKIQKPLNESERIGSVIESLQQSEIMKKLLEDYRGHTVPAQGGIANNIARTWDLKDTIANRVAEIFLKNVGDFNLTNLKGELTLQPAGDKPKDDAGSPGGNQVPPPKPLIQPSEDTIEIPVPLKNGKRAYIRLPEGYNDGDLKRISKFVDALRDDEDDKN